MVRPLDCIGRPRHWIIAFLTLLPILGAASTALQSDLDRVLSADPRNAGISVSVHTRDSGQKLVYDLVSVAPTNSMSDVFRVFLQFASAEKDRRFSFVELSFRGRSKFVISGNYFQRLGKEFGTQNPVYTIRTFPENLTRLDGSRAYSTWTGGLIGVSGKQLEDFNDFHRLWWLMDISPAAATASLDANKVLEASPIAQADSRPAATGMEPQAVNIQPISSIVAGSNSAIKSSTPMEVPKWLNTFPGSRDRAETSSPGAIDVSYTAPASPDEVVRFYRERFDHDGIAVHVAFNGLGTTIQAFRDSDNCVIGVTEASAGATVSAKCANHQSGSATPAAPVAPPPLPAGFHRVEYSISGSAGAVGLTYRNPTGGTEQRDVVLPGSLSFNAEAGQFVYVSAQNRTNSGDVHVSITVDGRPLQQATSTTPFGIATASGAVPR